MTPLQPSWYKGTRVLPVRFLVASEAEYTPGLVFGGDAGSVGSADGGGTVFYARSVEFGSSYSL